MAAVAQREGAAFRLESSRYGMRVHGRLLFYHIKGEGSALGLAGTPQLSCAGCACFRVAFSEHAHRSTAQKPGAQENEIEGKAYPQWRGT